MSTSPDTSGIPAPTARPASSTTDHGHLPVLVVGGGQAGLATSYHLTRAGIEHQVLDAERRTGDQWRRLWDSLELYSPARLDGLPGLPFPGPGDRFPTKDEVADYLEDYAARFALPVQHQIRATRLSRPAGADGPFLVESPEGRRTADAVVLTTGTFGRAPAVPELAGALDPAIYQLHSSDYRRPEQLPDGPALVVGASHSGHDIAHELAAHRPTVLAGRDCGQIPLPLHSRRMRAAFPVLWFVWGHVMNRHTPVGRRMLVHTRHHGGPALRWKRADLLAAGVERLEERVTGVVDGRPQLAGGRVLDVRSVVWATGYRHTLDWVELPVLGEDGWPREQDGVATDVPDLYFCGLSFQTSFRSMLIGGAGEDAARVVQQVTARHGAAARAAAA
ncbi:flavin-containing monooxygenase [Ornithinicoccus halotolerans]|uniref:flavin-containing monooxygenase n=1 Tax=Ornithinicoccus halotolerans TaxID=1748220 RepID=UPI001294E0CE|nr:NAD(P)/FAD-dependent oxidoreductase [Ornithinicoccus halotolerans]